MREQDNYRHFVELLYRRHLMSHNSVLRVSASNIVCLFSRGLEVLLDGRAKRARYVDSTWVKSWDYVAPHGCDFIISGRKFLPPFWLPPIVTVARTRYSNDHGAEEHDSEEKSRRENRGQLQLQTRSPERSAGDVDEITSRHEHTLHHLNDPKTGRQQTKWISPLCNMHCECEFPDQHPWDLFEAWRYKLKLDRA